MEPNNFDNQIKNKLEGRMIEPSNQSWDRLDAMLSLNEKPKKKSLSWFTIAASLAFVIGLLFWFTKDNSTVPAPMNSVVTVEDNNTQNSDKPKLVNEKEKFNQNEIITTKLLPKAKNNLVYTDVERNKSHHVKNTQGDPIIKTSKTHFEQQKVVENISKGNSDELYYVSPEKLLALVNNEKLEQEHETIITNSKTHKSAIKINANSLLSSVEDEISEEYRETSFDKLKRNFNEIKSAVANRNYE